MSPRARGAEHTAEALGTDAFFITRSAPIAKLHWGNFDTSQTGGMDWIYILSTTRKMHLVWGNFEHKTTDLVIEPDGPD